MILTVVRGDRVRVRLTDGTEAVLIFTAVTPKKQLVCALPGTGTEWRTWMVHVAEIVPEPVVCPDCSAEHQVDRESKRCADCERDYARRQPTPRELCEDCGAPGAVYSPLAKAFKCSQCHAKGGTLTGSSAEARVLTEGAICRSDDVHSLRHDWTRSKSSFLCRGCKIKTQTRPKGYTA